MHKTRRLAALLAAAFTLGLLVPASATGATHGAAAPRIRMSNGACGTFTLINGTGDAVRDNGLDKILTLTSLTGTAHFCMASVPGTGYYKMHVQSNQSHCASRTNGTIIIANCMQGVSPQQWAFSGFDGREDWGGVSGCCQVYTNFDTQGSQLFYAASGGPWDAWGFNQTNKRTTAHTTAARKASQTMCLTGSNKCVTWPCDECALRIQSSGAGTVIFQDTNHSLGGHEAYKIRNANGKCASYEPTQNGPGPGLVVDGDCVKENPATAVQWWVDAPSNGRLRFFSYYSVQDWLGTEGTSDGTKLRAERPHTGFYTGWTQVRGKAARPLGLTG